MAEKFGKRQSSIAKIESGDYVPGAMAFVFSKGSLQSAVVLLNDQETKLFIPLVKR